MEIIINQTLKDIDGKPLTETDPAIAMQKVANDLGANTQVVVSEFIQKANEAKGEKLTVRKVLMRALLNNIGEDNKPEKITPDESQRRFNIANRMRDKDKFDLSEKDRDIIKKKLTVMYTSVVVPGQIMNIINPLPSPKPDEKEEDPQPKK